MPTDKILLTNIQRFSLHDGPGIRTTVFLKGCSLQCPWCSNPENILFQKEFYIKDGVTGTYGKWMKVDEIYDEIIKDKLFYDGEIQNNLWNVSNPELFEKLPGGVTFSGGEALLQIEALIPLLQRLNKNKIHTVVETCLFVPEENVIEALRFFNLFIVDIKIISISKTLEIEKGNLEQYLNNFEILMRSGYPVVIRIPVIGGYTDDRQNQMKVSELLKTYIERSGIVKIELIKEHNLGLSKYESLISAGKILQLPNYVGVSSQTMAEYKRRIEVMLKEKNRIIPVQSCEL